MASLCSNSSNCFHSLNIALLVAYHMSCCMLLFQNFKLVFFKSYSTDLFPFLFKRKLVIFAGAFITKNYYFLRQIIFSNLQNVKENIFKKLPFLFKWLTLCQKTTFYTQCCYMLQNLMPFHNLVSKFFNAYEHRKITALLEVHIMLLRQSRLHKTFFSFDTQ